jgi:hypothetical protein
MQQKAIWMEQCIACRRTSKPEPTWEQFLASRRSGSPLARFLDWRREMGRTFYQAAIHHFSTRCYRRLIPAMLAAAALEPGLVLGRVLPRLVTPRNCA